MTHHYLHYILDAAGNPLPEPNFLTWAMWMDANPLSRRVGNTIIGKSRVSTVFLGLNHSLGSSGGPMIWETMVFGGSLEGEQRRCSGNREQAEAMHEEVVRMVEMAEGVSKEET